MILKINFKAQVKENVAKFVLKWKDAIREVNPDDLTADTAGYSRFSYILYAEYLSYGKRSMKCAFTISAKGSSYLSYAQYQPRSYHCLYFRKSSSYQPKRNPMPAQQQYSMSFTKHLSESRPWTATCLLYHFLYRCFTATVTFTSSFFQVGR